MSRPRTARSEGVARHRHGASTALLLAAAVALVFLPGCRLATAPVSAPAPAAPVVAGGPAIEAGASDAAEALEVLRLLSEGEAHLAAGRALEARAAAVEVATRLPRAEGSALALLLRARASRVLSEWQDADAALSAFLALLAPADPLHGEALVLRATVRWDGGLDGGVETLFALPPTQSPDVLLAAEELATRWAATMDSAVLRDLISEAPRHPVLLPVFLTELGTRRYLAGAEAEGRGFAEEALALAPGGGTAMRARSIVEGTVASGAAVSAILGAILPRTGSPSVQQLAAEIREGMEVALRVEGQTASGIVQLLTVDEPATTDGLRAALAELESGGAMAVIGPLEEPALDVLARAGGGIAMLSPTARLVPEGVGGAFSLAGIDPEAGRSLAALVLREGVRDVVVIHPSNREMIEEARWFAEAFRAGGGTILRTLTYPVGTTSFASQMQEILRVGPRGLVLLLPQGEVEVIAPQLAFYGVDEIDTLTRFGNEAWTNPAIVQGLQPRFTNGVLAVTSWVGDGEFGPGWNAFVAAYEDHFRRTLRSPVPALGYDSARLLLHAARLGGGSSEGTLRAFQEIRDFPGATGVLSVVDGRVRRNYQPVRIENRRVIPLSP